jgi:hypothetical protein
VVGGDIRRRIEEWHVDRRLWEKRRESCCGGYKRWTGSEWMTEEHEKDGLVMYIRLLVCWMEWELVLRWKWNNCDHSLITIISFILVPKRPLPSHIPAGLLSSPAMWGYKRNHHGSNSIRTNVSFSKGQSLVECYSLRTKI